ncbi:MAG: hypothetical protein DI536_08690 [Archangium gephyra]|uniref:Uncharacterized protein n=1 Tax=Archangium gephyra TaxID=48 RepID=A0A2W5TSM5_9BACT|nr:MAG: hypothetical protein DI536_08690 [Archangium gephyra]
MGVAFSGSPDVGCTGVVGTAGNSGCSVVFFRGGPKSKATPSTRLPLSTTRAVCVQTDAMAPLMAT